MIRAVRHRLPADRYIGEINLAITARLMSGHRGFTDSRVVAEFIDVLSKHAQNHRCRVPIYCFMPDHLHMLVQGVDPAGAPKVVVDEFKRSTSLWLARNRPGVRWQRSYYDHIIRNCEDWREQARYIYCNPVRAGMVRDPAEFRFSGSIGYEFTEVIDGLSWMFV